MVYRQGQSIIYLFVEFLSFLMEAEISTLESVPSNALLGRSVFPSYLHPSGFVL